MDVKIVTDDGNVVRLLVSGRIAQKQTDADDEPIAKLLGKEGYGRKALLDLGQAEYIDSSGVSWLLVAHKRFRSAGGKIVVYNIPPLVLNVLKVLRMQLVFDLAGDENEAVRKVEG
jgi:anti-sigma B factor antagonist